MPEIKQIIVVKRDGKKVDYYDLDDGIDEPTPLEKLLWKNNEF